MLLPFGRSFGRTLLLGLCLLSTAGVQARAQVIEIPAGGISDHGNPYINGSVAQWFLRGKTNTEYVLTSETQDYPVLHTLKLPEGATLRSRAGQQAKIVARGDIEHMIELKDRSAVLNLNLDANNIAFSAIYGRKSNNVRVIDNAIRNSRSTLAWLQCQQDVIRTHLVSIWDSRHIEIHNNVLENSGIPALGSPQSSCAVKSNSLSLKNSNHVDVSNNVIRNSASGGIDITDTIFVTITDNVIERSGANRRFWGAGGQAKISDGIVGYANPMRSPATNFYRVIHDNTITDWGNHGIHVSGRMHSIRGNRITRPTYGSGAGGHAIYVGDRENHIGGIQCSAYMWIQDNVLQSANEAILIDFYNASTLFRASNSIQSGGTRLRNAGCNGAEWR